MASNYLHASQKLLLYFCSTLVKHFARLAHVPASSNHSNSVCCAHRKLSIASLHELHLPTLGYSPTAEEPLTVK